MVKIKELITKLYSRLSESEKELNRTNNYNVQTLQDDYERGIEQGNIEAMQFVIYHLEQIQNGVE